MLLITTFLDAKVSHGLEAVQTVCKLIKLSDGYYVRLRTINGTNLLLLIDTGSFTSYFSEKCARKMHIGPGNPESMTVSGAFLGQFRVDPFKLHSFRGNKDYLDPQADGILGLNVLWRYSIGLNLSTKSITFFKTLGITSYKEYFCHSTKNKKHVDAHTDKVSSTNLTLGPGQLYFLNITVGRKDVSVPIDTGSETTLLGSIRVLPLFSWKSLNKVDNEGLSYGDALTRYYQTNGVSLSDRKLVDSFRFGVLQNDPYGMLGCDVLDHMNLLIDFSNRKMYFLPLNSGANRKVN